MIEQNTTLQDNNVNEVNKRNWKKYNEELVVRGKFYIDLDFKDTWYDELNEMNYKKNGRPYKFPQSFIKMEMVWHQFVDYRGIEGMARKLSEYNLIPEYNDYTTIFRRICKLKPDIVMPEYNDLEIASDGTGMKTSGAGQYRIYKWGKKGGKKNKFLVITITAEVNTKKLLSIDSHIEGRGNSEASIAEKHIKNLSMKGYNIKKFYGDGAYDTNNMFYTLDALNIESGIKIRKNAAPENMKGSKYRRREARLAISMVYKLWVKIKNYGKRWNGTEGINSSVKRKYGEALRAKKPETLECEGYQKFLVYDMVKTYGEIHTYGAMKMP